MKKITAICALATALAFGCGSNDTVRTEVVRFPPGDAKIDYDFTFKHDGDELLSVTGPNNYGTLSCFYTPGNEKHCSEAEHPITPEQREKAKQIYQNGEKQ